MTHWFPIESPGGGSALRRSGDARIAGVSGGLEARLGIDRNIIRVAFVLLALAGGAGFAVYLGAWILMPAEGTASPARPTVAVVVGAGLLAIGAILALVTIGGIEPLGVVILGLAFAGITVLNRRPRPQPSSPIGPDPLADPALAADSPPPYPFIPPPTLVVPPPPSPPPPPPPPPPPSSPSPPPPPPPTEIEGPGSPTVLGTDQTTEIDLGPHPDPTTEIDLGPDPATPPPTPPPVTKSGTAVPTDAFWANTHGWATPVEGGQRAHWAMTRTADETILEPPPGRAPRRPPGPPLASIAIAALAAILGLALVMTTVAGSSVGAVAVIGTGLAVVGLLMIISAFVGRTARLVPLAVLLLLLLPAAPIIDQAISDGVGTTDVALSSVDNLASSYRQGVGELRLDLSRLEITEDTPVEAVIGTGSMVIIVPSETAVELRAATTIGSVAALGRERAGIGSSLDIQPPPSVDSDAPRLILDVSATIGSVEVYRGRTIVADGE